LLHILHKIQYLLFSRRVEEVNPGDLVEALSDLPESGIRRLRICQQLPVVRSPHFPK
jgi:hypothetical protein